ncbi:amino acid adenylation domain-containing protein [Amycolatopsis lurida]|uniref:amino acid adenylation domain-containing protein n=1 Tax=Amycolatopsis lurida TaxID=31959 RepID=UPI00364BFBAE
MVSELVHEFVRAHADRTPAAAAIHWEGGNLSYRELVDRADAVTAALGGTDEAVAVRLPQGETRIAALLGVLGAGAHLSWLGTGDLGERGRVILGDLRPAYLLIDGDGADDALASWYRDECGGKLVDAVGLGTEGLAAPSTVEPSGRAYVAHTSGSTGVPKGVPQTHAAFAQFTTWFAAEFGIGPGSRVAQWVTPEHDPALIELFATLVAGGTVHPVPEGVRAHPVKLAEWLGDNGITHLQTIPSFAAEIVRAIEKHDLAARLTSLGQFVLMGEAVSGDLVRGLRAALPAARLVNLYGPTETIAATWHPITEPDTEAVPIGRAIPGRRILVVDEHDRPCPDGVTGEIVVLSPYVSPGYTGAAADRDAAFRPLRTESGLDEGIRTYRTGDLARRRADGALEFRGRSDNQVKVAGHRIELTDIELTLSAQATIVECAVVAKTDHHGLAAQLVAYVVPAPGAAPDGRPPRAWRTALRERLGRDMPPILFTVLRERLPRNAIGKVDRRRLPAPERR